MRSSAKQKPESASSPLDVILAEVCSALQLSPTQYKDAKQKYEAVGDWLARCPRLGALKPEVYPQGSVAIGTTVKPRQQDEFDVDLVIQVASAEADPHRLYELVASRLEETDRYRPMVERKNRCIRLNYTGDIHLDALPAKPAPGATNGEILVPDRELSDWSDSNPRGYAAWFLAKAEGLYFEARKRAEPLPEPEDADDKPPLKRAVQLLKRRRDLVFDGGEGVAPRSIVLTTLAARMYAGQLAVSTTLLDVVANIRRLTQETSGILVVPNPQNEAENFAEKWNAHSYRLFVRFIDDFHQDLQRLARLQGLSVVSDELSGLFGEEYVEKAMNRFSERARRKKDLNALRVAGTGLSLGASGRKIPKHDFFGG